MQNLEAPTLPNNIAIVASGTWKAGTSEIGNLLNANIFSVGDLVQIYSGGIIFNVFVSAVQPQSILTASPLPNDVVPGSVLTKGQSSSSISPQIALGQLVVAANSTNSKNFSVPPGTHTIGIAIEQAAVCSSLIITGVQTGTVYVSLPPLGATQSSLSGYFVSPILSVIDTTVTIQAASVGGATLDVVAILDTEAQFVFNNTDQPTAVNQIGSTGVPLGDTTTGILSVDQFRETATGSPGSWGAIIVSLKPTPGLQIKRVGALGAFTVGGNLSVTPPFGQPTIAGNTLVAWVSSNTEATTATPGWVKAIADFNDGAGVWDALWIKSNCGANEIAPTFTCVGATLPMFAQLIELSGVALVSPVDQTGNGTQLPPIFVETNAPDINFGDIVFVTASWEFSVSATTSFTDTWNNNAVGVHAGDSGAVSRTKHASFAYAIIPTGTRSFPLGTDVWPYDVLGGALPAAGVAPSAVLPAVPGKSYHIHSYSGEIQIGSSLAVLGQFLEILDGAAVIYGHIVGGTSANGQGTSIQRQGLGLIGTPGNSCTVKITGVGASNEGTVGMGVYIR